MAMASRKRKADEKDGDYVTSPEIICQLLHTPAEDFAIGDKPKSEVPIFVCYRSDKVVDVWKGLVKHNFLSCPVVLKDEQKYYGFVDLVDIVKYIIAHFGEKNILGKERDFWDMVKEEKLFASKTVSDIMAYPRTYRNPFHPVSEGFSALSVVEILAKEEGLHRLPVLDKNRQVHNLITQSQVIQWFYQNLNKLGSKVKKPLSACQHFFKPVLSVSEQSMAIEAFNLMVEKGITGVAVVDASENLVGNLSVRDMKLISYDARLFWRLQQPVKDFLVKLKRDWEEKHGRPQSVVVATKDSTLGDVISLLAENKIHRVYIHDENSKKAVGIVSLKDVLLELIS